VAGRAQEVRTDLYVTNGDVFAVAEAGGVIYIGGQFTEVGRATGGGVPIDITSGALPAAFPKVTGTVYAVAADGTGGWYVGGQFTHVGGVPRLHLAHVASDLTVTPWSPNPNNPVSAMAVSGARLFVGGAFFNIAGQSRNRVAAFDVTTGVLTAWNPNTNSMVTALAADGSTVYLGGGFTNVGGQARNLIAAVNAVTGTPTSWNANASGSQVNALAVSGSTVYAGGEFTSMGGQTRNRIAALDAATGNATAWNPNANNTVKALVSSGSTIYAGGSFTTIGGQARNRIAALDAATGSATAWNPNANNTVDALVVAGATVYAGGSFTAIGSGGRGYVAAVDATTGAAATWSPNPDGPVQALALSGQTIYVGGNFATVGAQVRERFAALDAATGTVLPWGAGIAGANYQVGVLTVSGSTLYVGGLFGTIQGEERPFVGAIDLTTRTVTSWNPNPNGRVSAIAVSGSTVYLSGTFTQIGGQTRGRLAAVDATTGAATAWNPGCDGVVQAFVVRGATIYAAGGYGGTGQGPGFTTIGGQPRNNLAALDAATGLATGWNPSPNGEVNALVLRDSIIYAGGSFTTIGGQPRDRIAALDATTGAPTAWNPSSNNDVFALALSGSTVYVGGGFQTIGGMPRSNLAAVDATNGGVLDWNPAAGGQRVFAMTVAGHTVYAGGRYGSLGGLPQSNFGGIAAAPVLTGAQPATGGDAGEVTVTFSGEHLRSGTVAKLARTGHPDIPGVGVTVTPGSDSLTATFDLRGAALGGWDVVLTTPDSQVAQRSSGFTVEPTTPRELRVDVIGPSRMRPNRPKPFDIVVQNQGNNDAMAVPLWISRIPVDATVGLDFPLASPPRDGGEPDWSIVPLTFTSPAGKYLALVIPRIPPGVTARRIYLTVPNTVASFDLDVALAPPWTDGEVFRSCLSSVISNPSCMGSQLTAIDTYLAATTGIQALSGIGLWAKIAWQCEGAATLPAALAEAEEVLDFMLQPVESGVAQAGCEVALVPRWQDRRTIQIVTSVDPNDKLGINGVGPSRLIGRAELLPYSIRFENLQTASAPAQEVVVTDALDGTVLDLNTVTLSAIKFGRRANGFPWTVEPPPGLNSYTTQVDLRPELPLIARVGFNYDRATGVIAWSFRSIDPTTGQPTTNDEVGFLPPNLTPPEGEGSLLFTVMAKPGLAGGTVIRNRATITFDDSTQLTPDWLNTLDVTPPESQVLPLGATQDSSSFTVSWAASGSPPDLRDFSVYVSENGGPFRPWRLHVTTTSDTIVAAWGGNLSFYSLARDSSGNLESVPPNPDVETFSRVGVGQDAAPRLALAGSVPNPATDGARVWFTLASRERAVLEVMDVAGRRVWRREVGTLGPGQHSVDVSAGTHRPGLYFLRLTQGAEVLHARMAAIR
jgi:hypothetical protein